MFLTSRVFSLRSFWCCVAVSWGLCFSVGCYTDDGEDAPAELPPYDAALCLESGPEPLGTPREVAVTGVTNNTVQVAEGFGWVVHSGDNTVGRFDLDTGGLDIDFIDVGDGRNPWDVEVVEDRVYITNFLAGTVTVASAQTGEVIAETPAGDLRGPTGLSVAGAWVVVAESAYVGPGYDSGAFVVFRRLDVPPYLERVGALDATALNPADVVWDAERSLFYGVSTGALGPGDSGFVAKSAGGMDGFAIRDNMDGTVAFERVRSLMVEPRSEDKASGAPRTLVIGGGVGYLPSMVAGELYKVDLSEFSLVRGPDDPIRVYLGEGDQLTDFVWSGGAFGYVLSYNQDAVYTFDTTCDASVAGPVSVGSSRALEGALRAAWDPRSERLWVITTVSSALWSVPLDAVSN